MSNLLPIGEVARRSGVASSALRFYEQRGLISSERTGSGHRHYPRPVLRRIAFIVFALLIARPVAIFLSFVRVDLPQPHRAFIAWFGPKGVAGMLFAVLVLNSGVERGNAIFEAAAFVILASILIHGATDTLGTNWIERRIEADEEPGEEADPGLAAGSGAMP